MINRKVNNVQEALQDIQSGQTIMLGGFGLCGIPEKSIAELVKKEVTNLTCISNNAGVDDFGIGLMLKTRQVKKMISSYVGENKEFERQLLSGELEVELTPQGTLAERIRAGGAGIPAFFTPAGVGTEVAEGKEIQEFDGKKYVRESWLKADFAIVKAWKADTAGNLIFKGTAQNFSPMMAAAGKITIAEVEELVPAGSLDPAQIHTPGIYVQRIFQGKNYEKRIEQRTVSKIESNLKPMNEAPPSGAGAAVATGAVGLDKNQIAKRIAREVKDGDYVNLGIGIPTLVANYIPAGVNVVIQSENGLCGMGPFTFVGAEDPKGFTSLLTYDSNNNVTASVDKRGNSAQYQYDSTGNTIQITDARGGIIHVAYDAQNNPLTITNQRNFTTILTFSTYKKHV